MDGWIVFNFAAGIFAFWVNVRRVRRSNPRMGMRLAACAISLWITGVYLFVMVGLLNQSGIPPLLRWTQGAIMLYLIAEGRNG